MPPSRPLNPLGRLAVLLDIPVCVVLTRRHTCPRVPATLCYAFLSTKNNSSSFPNSLLPSDIVLFSAGRSHQDCSYDRSDVLLWDSYIE